MRNQQGLAHFLLIVVVVAVVIIASATFYLQSKGGKIEIPGLPKTSQEVKPQTQRRTGHAKLVPSEGGGEEVDTPRYAESFKGEPVGKDGISLKSTLKNQVDIYLVIPPNPVDVNYVELSEFSDLPTSETHIPLYTDLGFGVNVAIEGARGGLNDPAYLVFDFSKGKKLEEFKKMTSYTNHCDFSTPAFLPEVCASLLNIPADKTLGSKYIAVSPKRAEDGRTPTFPVYSYYLGSEDLLVVRIDDSVMIIPQPLTVDLANDLVADSFQKYAVEYELYEAMDIIRNLKLKVTDQAVLFDIWKKFSAFDFKTLYASSYLVELIEASGDEENLQRMKRKDETVIADVFEEFAKDATSDLFYMAAIGNANLRRAYDAKIAGSAKKSKEVLAEIFRAMDEREYSEDEEIYAVEGALILMGQGKLAQVRSSKYAFMDTLGQVLGETSNLPQDSDQERSEFEKEVERRTEEIKVKAEVIIQNTLANEHATLSELINALALAQLLGLDDKYGSQLTERILERAKKDLENAGDDDAYLNAYRNCLLVGADCGNDSKAKDILKGRCYVVIGKKTLKNFADQSVDRVICDDMFSD